MAHSTYLHLFFQSTLFFIADAVFNPSGKKFHGEIKFKDLPPELKEAILYKLPNNFSLLERQMRIINRVHCAKGWCGYYECATDKSCSSSCTIVVNEDGSNEPVVTVKKQHTCASQASAMSLIDAKNDMIAMVKERAIVCSSDRAPVIAMDVWKHFANLHSGVRLLYLFCYLPTFYGALTLSCLTLLGRAYSSLDLKFMENLVYRTRHLNYPNWKALIFSEPFVWCREDDQRPFTRFSCEMIVAGERCDFVGISHPDMIFEIGDTQLHGFIDCTFSIVPSYFLQVLILMVYFSKYDLYVPVYFVLMQVLI